MVQIDAAFSAPPRRLPFPVPFALPADTLSVAQTIAHVRKATWSRTAFALLMALLACTVISPWLAAAWAGAMTVWEIAVRPLSEDAFAARARSRHAGFGWLAAINFIGSAGYTLFPLFTWWSGEPLGMVLATAWICASANHLFVYFSAHRLLLGASLAPLTLLAVTAPFLTGGFSLPAAVGVAALACLIFSAGMFGFDRQVLLGNLARLATARASAEAANAAKSRFLATMSHELRTPLNSVIGYAELIEEEADGAISEDAGKIRVSARQLLSVIDVILDLSKLESGAIELQRERADAAAALEQLREAAPPLAALNNNRLVIERATPLGDADIDHARLYQCLLQLTSNAAKFTENGEIRIDAARETDGAHARLVFHVRDTGIGIDPAQHARIFEPFVQAEAEADRRFEGAGLGLALVKRLAVLMGGDVSVESAPGRGSCFTLWIDAGPAN